MFHVQHAQRRAVSGISALAIAFSLVAAGSAANASPLESETAQTQTVSSVAQAGARTSAAATGGSDSSALATAAQVTSNAAPATLTVSNAKADGVPWQVGEVVQFAMTVTNNTDIARSFKSVSSNLTKWEGCKWTKITPGQTLSCVFATHTITEADQAAGSFTPSITWGMYSQAGYLGDMTTFDPTTGSAIPVAQSAATINSFDVNAETTKSSYKAGDQLTFSLVATNTADEALAFSLADASKVKGSCAATNVGAHETFTCTALTYTITETDLEKGSVDPQVLLDVTKDGTILQRVAATAHVETNGSWPAATGFEAPDADPNLEANITSALSIASSDADNNIRIPAIAVASNGDILAAYDKRPKAGGGGGDSPNANWIMQRRSTDGGTTWGPEVVIAQGNNGDANANGRKGYSDPSYVVDYTTGTIFNFHVYSQASGVFANNPAYTFNTDGTIDETNTHTMNLALSISKDNGYTWEQRIITNEVLGQKAQDLQSCFATSGAGTQKMQDPYRGRLLQQTACVKKDGTILAMTIYSDDHGETWHSGNFTSVTDGADGGSWVFNENKVVELSDGRLMLNSRTHGASAAIGHRIVAISDDGGVTWKDYRTQTDLIDPGNNAQIIRAFPNAEPGTLRSKVLLFSNTKNASARNNGTVSLSYDDGQTWPVSKEFRSANSSYTTMAVQPDGTIGLLYEPNGSGIDYLNFTLPWLTDHLATEPQLSDTSIKFAVDEKTVNIPLKFNGDDPMLANTVTVTGLPQGLSYNTKTGAIEGTPSVGNDSQQHYTVTVNFSEEDDGTGIPRTSTDRFTLALDKAGSAGGTYEGTTWYVSNDGSDTNDGLSPETAFKTTTPVNSLEMQPGDAVLFRRGDTFNGDYLHVKGSGNKDASIKISAYGDETKPRPIINTNGNGVWYEDYNTSLDSSSHTFQGDVSTSILLKDVEYVEVSDLEITNALSKDEESHYNDADQMDRTGVAVIAENIGTVNHVVLKNLYIHDVDGNVYNKHMANGGIYVIAHKAKDEAATGVARFDDVQILNNRVENVNRWGIGVGYTGSASHFTSAELSDDVMRTYGQTNVVIRGNYVKGAGGDAITTFYADRPLVEYNVSVDAARQINNTDYVNATSLRTGKNRGGKVAAAIWPWKSKNAVFQFNEAFNTLNSAQGNGDGQAWDADYGDGTIYQYNYSHGNTGGTVMFCGQQVMNSTFRYNISQNDLGGIIDIPDGLPEAHVYNNTFYIAEGVPVLGKHTINGTATIENNIFYNSGSTPATGNWEQSGGKKTYNNNLYYNFANQPASDTKAIVAGAGEKIMADPGTGPVSAQTNLQAYRQPGKTASTLTGTDAFSGYKLVEGSKAANSGSTIIDQNGFAAASNDFLGSKLEGATDVGAIQIAGDAVDPTTLPKPGSSSEQSGDTYAWVHDYQNNVQGPVWYAQYQDGVNGAWKNITAYDSTYPNWTVDTYYGPGIQYANHDLPDPDARGDIQGLLSDSPQSAGGTAMVFKAPKDGQITFTLKGNEPFLRQDGNTGGMVKLSLMHNDDVLESVVLKDSLVQAADWKSITAENPITVKTGDYIRLVAESIDNPTKPSLLASPTITYVESAPTVSRTTAEWKAYNAGLDDYRKLQSRIANSTPMTWLFTGDSITHGVMHTNGEKRFSEYFEDNLRTTSLECADRSRDIVLNTGVSSADTSWMRNNLAAYVTDRHADVVFIAFGMNDGRQDTPVVPLAQYRENLSKTIDEVRAAGGIPVLMTQNYTKNADNNANLDTYFAAERQLAEEKKVLFVDEATWWKENNGGEEINPALHTATDSIHPNAQGHLEWAKLILDSLGMLTKDSRLAETKTASVTPYGGKVKLPSDNAAEQFLGGTGLSQAGFLTAPKKAYTGAGTDLVTDGNGLAQFAQASAGNVTVRFKADPATDTTTEMVVASLADKDTGKVLTISIKNSSLRISRNFGSGYDFFTMWDQSPVKDGEFHTVSVNVAANLLDVYIDGKSVKQANLAGLNLDPARFDIDTVTLGGALPQYRDAMRKAGETAGVKDFVGTLDYVAAYPTVLDPAAIASIPNGESTTPAPEALAKLYASTDAQMWAFLGGATTQGTMTDLSAKNYVQAFEEVLRWEHQNQPAGMRMKYVENAGLNGLTSADLLERYTSAVKPQNPNVVFIAPDVLFNGKVVEPSVNAFTDNITELVDRVTADGAVPVLITPAQLGNEVSPYAQAMRSIAQTKSVVLVDATAWVASVDAVNADGVVAVEWYDANGFMRPKGQLELAKYLMETIQMMPADVSSSRIWALNYDGDGTPATSVTPVFAKSSECKVEPVAVTPEAVTFRDADGVRTYTVPRVAGVEYLVDGKVVGAGTYDAEAGATVTLTARAAGTAESGGEYVLAEGAETSWSHEFSTGGSGEPTDQPTGEPTDRPTGEPTTEPTGEPSQSTAEPSGTSEPSGSTAPSGGSSAPTTGGSHGPTATPGGTGLAHTGMNAVGLVLLALGLLGAGLVVRARKEA